jgi:hypothetical protein
LWMTKLRLQEMQFTCNKNKHTCIQQHALLWRFVLAIGNIVIAESWCFLPILVIQTQLTDQAACYFTTYSHMYCHSSCLILAHEHNEQCTLATSSCKPTLLALLPISRCGVLCI